MIKRVWFTLVSIVLLAAAIATNPAMASSGDIELWKTEPAAKNGLFYRCEGTSSIGGVVVEGFVSSISANDSSVLVVWRVPDGYTTFSCRCGFTDDAGNAKPVKFEVLLDGDSVKEFTASKNDKPVSVRLPVRSGQSIRVTFNYPGIVGEPKFTKGTVSSTSGSGSSGSTAQENLSCPVCGAQFEKKSVMDYHIRKEHAAKPADPEWFKCITCGMQYDTREGLNTHISSKHSTPSPSAIRTFSLDPSGLDRLAETLWKQCQNKPAIKEKVANGNVAVATLKPIGTLPSETPNSVAADIYTAMIKSGFSLVERGQLDKVLHELKIQDTGLIDPATAAKIGKLSGADLMLLGEITDSDSLVVINARLMDTATGKSVAAERVELRKIFARN